LQFKTGVNGSPDVLGYWRSLTVAKITSKRKVSGGPLTGQWVYEWTEQIFDSETGLSIDSPNPRKGTYTNTTVFENVIIDVNNTEFLVGQYVWCRLKGQVYGTTVYETAYLDAGGGGGGGDSLCGGCGWMADVPTTTCMKFRVLGGNGRCSCIVAEGFAEAGYGTYVTAFTGWLASNMKKTCCGCGGAIFRITGDTTATLTYQDFHVSCQGGSAAGLFTLDLTLECCGIDPLTGKPFAQFRGWGPDACDGEVAPCDNTFVVIVECYDCPDPICDCCCTDYSPYSWYANVLSFASDTMNGFWVWEHVEGEGCKWYAECYGVESLLEYVPEETLFRLTHGGFVYELAFASWSCHGSNSMNYVSGSGAHPAVITVKAGQDLGIGTESPCQLPDDLSVTVQSSECDVINVTVTVTRPLPGIDNWTYTNTGDGDRVTGVTVQCENGQWSVAVTAQCDADPTPIAFGADSSGAQPDTSHFIPFELVWVDLPISGTPTVEGCCTEGSTATITVTE
jgi:hypothetical protein